MVWPLIYYHGVLYLILRYEKLEDYTQEVEYQKEETII